MRSPLTAARLPLQLLLAALLASCASLQYPEPPEVIVAGIEPLAGQGLELRMLVKLRVQNPNDRPIDYNGVFIRLDVQERRFATGVSAAGGSVPRYGEALIEVPVSISALDIVRQAMGMMGGNPSGKLAYELRGTLDGPGLRNLRFDARGELALPPGLLEDRR